MNKELYFNELGIVLGRSGFTTQPEQDGPLPVEYEGRRLCRVNADGSVFYNQDDVTTLDREAACRRVTDSAAIVQEYMTLLERASILQRSWATRAVQGADRIQWYSTGWTADRPRG